MSDQFVERSKLEIRKMPRTTSRNDRHSTWPNSLASDWPDWRRLLNENAAATPTMNMNDG